MNKLLMVQLLVVAQSIKLQEHDDIMAPKVPSAQFPIDDIPFDSALYNKQQSLQGPFTSVRSSSTYVASPFATPFFVFLALTIFHGNIRPWLLRPFVDGVERISREPAQLIYQPVYTFEDKKERANKKFKPREDILNGHAKKMSIPTGFGDLLLKSSLQPPLGPKFMGTTLDLNPPRMYQENVAITSGFQQARLAQHQSAFMEGRFRFPPRSI